MPPGWLVTASTVAASLAALTYLLRGRRGDERWLLAAGGLAVLPALIAAALETTSWIAARLGPLSGSSATLLLVAPSLALALGALAVHRLTAARRLDVPRPIAATLLAVMLLPSLAFVGGAWDAGEPPQARHTWQVTVDPADDDPADETRYRLEVPFLVATEPRALTVLAQLRAAAEVTEGQAELSWTDDATTLVLDARGPVTVTAEQAFLGPIEDRRAFASYRLAHRTVTLDAEATTNATVETTLSFSDRQASPGCLLEASYATLASTQRPMQLGPRYDPGDPTSLSWATVCP